MRHGARESPKKSPCSIAPTTDRQPMTIDGIASRNQRQRDDQRRLVRRVRQMAGFVVMHDRRGLARRVRRRSARSHGRSGSSRRKLYNAVTNTPISTAPVGVAGTPAVRFVHGLDDRVLREEAGEARHAGQRERADHMRDPRDRHVASRRPPMLRMSCSWCIAMITEPAPRNSSALKNACVIRWKIAGRVRRRAERDRHVAELRQRRIGDDALDVVAARCRSGR